MKVLLQKYGPNLPLAKIKRWTKLISITGSAQIIVQGLSLLCGILIIRLLPTDEYAFYTLSNTMLATMTILADGGITAGVMSQGGKVWMDREKLGSVFVTGLGLRKKFAIGSLLITVPLLLFLLRHHGATWLMSLLITFSIIPPFFAVLSNQLLEIIPKLHQDIAPIQKIAAGVSFGRIVLICLSLFLFPLTFVALLANGFPQIWGNRSLIKLSKKYAEIHQKADVFVQKKIISFVKKLLPGDIYYCVSGQITIWLISIFGTTASVAHIGALSRLAMVFVMFDALFSSLIYPRFARMQNNWKMLFKRFLLVQIGILFISAGTITTVWLFSKEILWLLGKEYSNLKVEAVLLIVSSCLTLLASTSRSLYINRGWAINPFLFIPFEIVTIAIGVALINITTLTGIITLNIFIAASQVILHSSFAYVKILSVKRK